MATLALFCLALATTLTVAVTPVQAKSVRGAILELEQRGAITPELAETARDAYADARKVRRRTKGARRQAIRYQIGIVEAMARSDLVTADRVRPLFVTLQHNAEWFRSNGPAAYGTDKRFGKSRIIFQYFTGMGWQFHPLSNFAKLNAVWTVKSQDARRALGKYAYELLEWGVDRGGALTWEYYFPFSGSTWPFISSISQGTAAQSLARAGSALSDPAITDTARRATLAFDRNAPTGLKLKRKAGNHYLGYSGNRKLRIYNIFLQSLNGLRDYSKITDDAKGWELYREGLRAARRETKQVDTGAWSLYSVGGRESSLHYHRVTVGFLEETCGNTGEDGFCDARARFDRYTREQPRLTNVRARIKGKRLKVSFRLSKISTVTVSASRKGSTAARGTAVLRYGNRRFEFKKPRKKGRYTVRITAVDLAGNRSVKTVKLRVK